jgi:hypothetical protein
MQREQPELLGRDYTLEVRFHWSAGPYLGRFLQELRDNGRLWAIKCLGCGRLLMPPRIVCAVCYTEAEEFPRGWVQLSGRGVLEDWERILYPQMDPETGKVRPEPFLHGTFRLDEGVLFVHYLGPQDLDESRLRVGMRVEMVMKPPEQREGKMTDIHYFRLVEGD